MSDEQLDQLHFYRAMLKMSITNTALHYTTLDVLKELLKKVSGIAPEQIERDIRDTFNIHRQAVEDELNKKAPGTTMMIFPEN